MARTRVASVGDAVRHRGVLGTTTTTISSRAGLSVPRLLLHQVPPVTCTYTGGNLRELLVLGMLPFFKV